MSKTEIMFLSHASVIIKYENEYLLTDPWYQSPGFGSWIPIPPMYVHPSYVTSLENLSILVSHAHDDHCDGKYLQLFDKNTNIYSSDFSSKGVMKRVNSLGFNNYQDIDSQGKQIGSFFIKSFRNEEVSLDDAMYTIRTPDALIIHCNDNWRLLPNDVMEEMSKEVAIVGGENSFYMSQNNAASGFPTIYTNIDEILKKEIAQDVVNIRLIEGMQNASNIQAKYFLPYAGYVGIFLKDSPELLDNVKFPSKKYIDENLKDKIPSTVEVVDMMPGDIFNFKSLHKSFFGEVSEDRIKNSSINYYRQYDIIKGCQTYIQYEEIDNFEITIEKFMDEFNNFVTKKESKDKFYETIIGKTFTIIITDDNSLKTIEFGKGIIEDIRKANLVLKVNKNLMQGVLNKEIIFENLHVGLMAEFERHPNTIHHRDILMYITMFSYYFISQINL